MWWDVEGEGVEQVWWGVEGEGVEQVVVRVTGDPSHSLFTVFRFSSRCRRCWWWESSLDKAPYPRTPGLIYSNLSPPLALCVSVYLNLRIFLHTHYKHLAWININTFRFHFLIFHQYIDNILTVFLLVCVDVVVVVWLVAGLSCIVYCIEKTKGYLYLLNHLLPLALSSLQAISSPCVVVDFFTVKPLSLPPAPAYVSSWAHYWSTFNTLL